MPLALVIATFGTMSCGAKPKDEKAQAAGGTTTVRASGNNATADKPTTTTTAAKPRTTIRNRPDCVAYERYSWALSAVAFAKPEKRAEVEKKADEVAANAKKLIPQLSSDIDSQLSLTKKAATPTGLNQADKDQLKKVGDTLTQWRTTTCL
ncbi:MAG: hypothetical protein N2037_01345 [Acidimicrobiales bacterium]|nr:hypothetical protein [Acidimicrobiales bacterium]